MKAFRAGLLTAALALAAAAGVAQAPESGPDAAPAPPPTEAPDEPAPEGFDREAADDDVFIPSDEIQADEEVTFPVDI